MIGFGGNSETFGIVNGAAPHLRCQGFQNFHHSKSARSTKYEVRTYLYSKIKIITRVMQAGRKAKPALWPAAPAEWARIGEIECRLKAGARPGAPPVLYLKNGDRDLKLQRRPTSGRVAWRSTWASRSHDRRSSGRPVGSCWCDSPRPFQSQIASVFALSKPQS